MNNVQPINWSNALAYIESNLLWELIIILIISIIPGLIKTIKDFRLLLKENRPSKNHARGHHKADRYLDIWKNELVSFNNSSFYKFGFVESITYQYVIDEFLQERKLIELIKTDGGRKTMVRPLKNWRTWLLTKMLKTYLIIFAGDKKTDYK